MSSVTALDGGSFSGETMERAAPGLFATKTIEPQTVTIQHGARTMNHPRGLIAEVIQMSIGRVVRNSIPALLSFALLICCIPDQGLSQTTQSPPPPAPTVPTGRPQIRPVSLKHLYWHFLVYQNHLDAKSAALKAANQNGDILHDYLQAKLGFSNSDFAPIRVSSRRLTAAVQSLDAQAGAIRAAGPPSAASVAQLQALAGQREAAIDAEVSYLRQTLSPEKVMALEAFLAHYFSLANASPPPPFATKRPAARVVQP